VTGRLASAPARQVAALNDALRAGLLAPSPLGRAFVSRGVAALGAEAVLALLRAVQAFDAFTPGNNPWQERDYGQLEFAGEAVLWKIDYYASAACEAGSENPADPAQSYRILTIMLAHEY